MFSDFFNYVLFFTMNELSAAHLPQTHSFQPLAFELLLFSNLLFVHSVWLFFTRRKSVNVLMDRLLCRDDL